MEYRTHNLNELRIENVGEKVVLSGWLETVRKVGKNFAFLVLRDFFGKTQVVVEDETNYELLTGLNCESVVKVEGVVRERSSKNPQMATGDIEVVCQKLSVLGKCEHNELPFEINYSKDVDEKFRLKYRYLDLRNPLVKKNIVLRSQIVSELRRLMTEQGFLEITTPILTASSPEGARDYVVPSRNYPGKFYALPQAPQQFKQLLMASGFDKYFQIAPCFRDEDARQDRSPGEFYQLDMEMSFAGQEDVFKVIESVIPPVFEKFGIYNKASKSPFVRIPFKEALEKYGSDKPDLRINLFVQDATEILRDVEFDGLKGKAIKAVVAKNFKESRKFIENLATEIEIQSEHKPYWFKTDEQNNFVGGISKFVDYKHNELVEKLGIEPNSLVFMTSGSLLAAQKTAGVALKKIAYSTEGYMDKECYKFCWIVDFPMYEVDEETGKLDFCHNPFSMPQCNVETLEKAKFDTNLALSINAYQYDLVCNGIELSSGAVRNHNPEIMIKAFDIIGLGEDVVKSKFPAMYNAFTYGAPPHAGIAPGVDRMVMLLTGEDNIREVIAFPMNKKAQDILMGAPSEISEKQLKEVHIKIVED